MRYAYDSEGYLQKIETDGTDYTFTYDNYGNLLTVKAGNYTLATNTYGPYDGALQTNTTGNGLQTAYEYDALGRVTGVKENGTLRYRVTYNGDGQVSRVEDKAAGHTTEYEYDGAGRLIRAYRADADGAPLLQAENLYDTYGRAKSSTYVMPGKTMGYTLNYVEESSLLDSITLPGGEEAEYSYDSFDRLLQIPDVHGGLRLCDRYGDERDVESRCVVSYLGALSRERNEFLPVRAQLYLRREREHHGDQEGKHAAGNI